MKTPNEITHDILTGLNLGIMLPEGTPKAAFDLTNAMESGWLDGDIVMTMVESGIQADRAQRAELLNGEADTLAWYAEHAEEIATPEGYTNPDDPEDFYDLGALIHNMERAVEAMRLVAGHVQ